MIYLQTVYSRRDPISVGLQTTFQPIFDLTEAMIATLRVLDASERQSRVPVPVRARGRRIG